MRAPMLLSLAPAPRDIPFNKDEWSY